MFCLQGNALVTGGTDKVVFVGSTGVGRMVMKAAAETLTPVVLELGGKDPFIVLEDAALSQCVPMALRGAFQSCGQNCAGAERFYVHEKIHDRFVTQVMKAANQLRQGWALSPGVDCGAMCKPNQAQYVQSLVDDAVAKVSFFLFTYGQLYILTSCFFNRAPRSNAGDPSTPTRPASSTRPRCSRA